MRVSVSGKQFVFPRSCACCGAYPLTTMPISGTEFNRKARTRGWVFEVPYCVACKRHIHAGELIALLGLLNVALSMIAGFIVGILAGSLVRGAELLSFLLLSGILACLALWRIVVSRQPTNCWRTTRSVNYLGSNGTVHTFEIHSRFFFAEFVRANHRKLVNASPQVVGILRGTKFGDFQVPRRIFGGRR